MFLSSFEHIYLPDFFFSNVQGKFSISFDAWTSKPYHPYLAITTNYIDVPSDQPSEWELKSKLMGFKELQGSHSGANIAVDIVEVLDKYNIRNKVSLMFGFIGTPAQLYFN